MILIVGVSGENCSLGDYEYVIPVLRIVSAAGFECRVSHISALNNLLSDPAEASEISGIIVCSTQMKDTEFAGSDESYAFLRETLKPVLLIGASAAAAVRLFYEDYPDMKTPAMNSESLPEMKVVRHDETSVSDIPHLLFGDRMEFTSYTMYDAESKLPGSLLPAAFFNDGMTAAYVHRCRKICGVFFNPEVRNEFVIENFCRGVCDDILRH